MSILDVKCALCGNSTISDGDRAVISKKTGNIYFDNVTEAILSIRKIEGMSISESLSSASIICIKCLEGIVNPLKVLDLAICSHCGRGVPVHAASCPGCGHSIDPEYPTKTDTKRRAEKQSLYVRCPTCASTNAERISSGIVAGKVPAFGILAVGKVSKTFRCNDCGCGW